MTAMTCKWNGLFNVGDDFDDEDLLEINWSVPSVSASTVSSAAQSCFLRSSTAASTPAAPYGQKNSNQPSTEGIPAHRCLLNCPGSENTTPTTVGQCAALGLRRLSTSKPLPTFPPPPLHLPTLSRGPCTVPQQSSAPAQQIHSKTTGQQEAPLPQDDFDDWDVDLADLDESDPQMRTWAQVRETAPAAAPYLTKPSDDSVSPAKRLRPSACGGAQTGPNVGLRGFSTSNQMSGLPSSNIPHRSSFPGPGLSAAFLPAPPQSPVFPGLTMASSPFSSPFPRSVTPRPVRGPPSQIQRPWATPLAQGCSLFDPISPAPSSRFGGPMPSPSLTPRSLHTPVFTNHLVQLVSNSNKTPQRPRSDHTRPNTRRFPGPAGMLPQQQLHGQSLDDIVVAIPQTPAHGAVARLPSQVPSSQTEEEDFSGGPWAAMKAEMGLDERNTSCFLHSYSVAMVLRKAALKQLAKNKVPNMAVVLKSILHTHADAKAVFGDPTGEMQGTVHRRLLEDRLGELKTGAVLLLKQVGVFSPSHRNHYLNVTPNNLLRIYPPDGSTLSSTQTQLLPPDLEPLLASPDQSSSVPGALVSQMELFYDDDEEEVIGAPKDSADSGADSTSDPQGPPAAAPQDPSWDADGLDELLGELPVESYCL
ncbi:homologous recombination OB-fold protein isoform X1 [Coregonus clupeaformis]|uniref:homologous recombination OB-fold protein isoform X1 n=1 Tax=Coregonus clupeaformis TaxID=59861 RepID=UPI001E1C7753|nr:homologous recombination OB-fold protein isoform X1 [Coregonus clupeaformis]XP_045071688.1 homologous recombination OB-fold protein isoform X1 [Coregonus clupeaformis]